MGGESGEMKTKLFYCPPWQAGCETEDEYRAWIDQYENSKDIRGFQLIAKSVRGNWLRVVYEYQTFLLT